MQFYAGVWTNRGPAARHDSAAGSPGAGALRGELPCPATGPAEDASPGEKHPLSAKGVHEVRSVFGMVMVLWEGRKGGTALWNEEGVKNWVGENGQDMPMEGRGQR